MTTIGATPYFPPTQRYATAERSTFNTNVADQPSQTVEQSSENQTNKLADLLSQADALKKNQLNMSIRDYLYADFTLSEQITAERRNAGEDVGTIGVRFEGRVFNVGAKHLGSFQYTKVSDSGMVQMVKPLEPGQTGVDIRA
ncbi:MAG: hypothetical protein ABIL01_14490 [Pseudomonadota bacterium]